MAIATDALVPVGGYVYWIQSDGVLHRIKSVAGATEEVVVGSLMQPVNSTAFAVSLDLVYYGATTGDIVKVDGTTGFISTVQTGGTVPALVIYNQKLLYIAQETGLFHRRDLNAGTDNTTPVSFAGGPLLAQWQEAFFMAPTNHGDVEGVNLTTPLSLTDYGVDVISYGLDSTGIDMVQDDQTIARFDRGSNTKSVIVGFGGGGTEKRLCLLARDNDLYWFETLGDIKANIQRFDLITKSVDQLVLGVTTPMQCVAAVDETYLYYSDGGTLWRVNR
jgi:hypothetical protein